MPKRISSAGTARQAGARLHFSLTNVTSTHLLPATSCWAVQVFASAGDTFSRAALSSTHLHLASAKRGRKGDGCRLKERAGPSVWARRWGSHRGDTPRCFLRQRLRAKHGSRSAFALERTVVSCFPLSCAVTPAGTESEHSPQGQSSDLSHKRFSRLAHVCKNRCRKFICVELQQGGVLMHRRDSHTWRGQILPRSLCLFYRLHSRRCGSELKFTIISLSRPQCVYLIYTSGITIAVRRRSKIWSVIRVEMKDLVYIQVILNGRALKPHPALLCISISRRLCAVK